MLYKVRNLIEQNSGPLALVTTDGADDFRTEAARWEAGSKAADKGMVNRRSPRYGLHPPVVVPARP